MKQVIIVDADGPAPNFPIMIVISSQEQFECEVKEKKAI